MVLQHFINPPCSVSTKYTCMTTKYMTETTNGNYKSSCCIESMSSVPVGQSLESLPPHLCSEPQTYCTEHSG